MKTSVKPLLLAGLLAITAFGVQAHPGERPGRMQEHLQERMARHAVELKGKLQLTPEQEGAWTSYLDALKPAAPAARPDRAEFERLSTPARLDKLRELRRQRDAEFDRREAATRSFYAGLSATQQKVFDEQTARLHLRRHHHDGRR